MRLAFYRINKEDKFTQIDNRMINDKELSAKAKGILLYLMSKPSDWKVYEADIVNNMKDGRDSIRSGIAELIENGYIERELANGEKGKFAGYNYNVYEHNSENPCWKNRVGKSDNGKPDNGKTDNGKPDTTNTKETKTKKSNTNLTKTKTTTEQSSSSEIFKFYESEFGPLSNFIAEEIGYMIEDTNEELVLEALKLSVRANKRTIKYAAAITRNWRNENIKSIDDLIAAQKAKGRGRDDKNDGRSVRSAEEEDYYSRLANFSSDDL